MVTDAGYDGIEAENTREAMSYLAEYPGVSFAITDVQTPKVDGLAFVRHIAAHFPQIAVIVASGVRMPIDGELRADALLLSKPSPPDTVLKAIEEAKSLN